MRFNVSTKPVATAQAQKTDAGWKQASFKIQFSLPTYLAIPLPHPALIQCCVNDESVCLAGILLAPTYVEKFVFPIEL